MWTGMPARAIAIRRCHQPPLLATFGLRAELASLSYGARAAFWCIGACWPWMLIPLTQPEWHFPLMILAFLVMLNDRYRRPPAVRLRLGPIAMGSVLTATALSIPAMM
jgi:predicted metal-binding membrane protein